MNAESLLTDHQEAIRQQVIVKAAKAFHTHGIRNVTMDSIAHSLTMSKRTLYQLFADKEELLLACAKLHHKQEHDRLEKVYGKADNVLDFLMVTFASKMHEMDHICASFTTDLAKFPRVMAYFEQQREGNMEETVTFLNRGIEQGVFRQEINFRIVYEQLTALFDHIMRTNEPTKYSHREIFVNTVIPYVRGCATGKGVEIIDKFMAGLSHKL